MSSEVHLTKEMIDTFLKELAIEYRRRAGKKAEAELILIGGASVLINYGFRDSTTDIDAIIWADSCMKDAIHAVSDHRGLPHDWLNADFTRTTSFSGKLIQHSRYYKTFAHVLSVRTVVAEYLVAMKLMAGRIYKNDLSDIIGILQAQREKGESVTREQIKKAFSELYGEDAEIPKESRNLLETVFTDKEPETLYERYRTEERENRELFLMSQKTRREEFKKRPIREIIEKMKQGNNVNEDQTPGNR